MISSASHPTLVVLGATGAQGSGVISAVLSQNSRHPLLDYHIRALTSNITSAKARSLAALPNVSVALVDTGSEESLLSAFSGATAIFATTAFPMSIFAAQGPAAAVEVESRQALNIVRAASKTPTLQHLIWSTLPNSEKLSGGKWSVPHFQSKVVADAFIRSSESGGLDKKTTMLCPGMYGSNLKMAVYTPVFVKSANKYTVTLPCSPDVKLPWVGDEASNVGTVARAIFSHPEKSLGRYVVVEAEFMSCREWIGAFSRASGKDAVYVEGNFSSYEELWGAFGTEIGVMMKYVSEVGEIAWTDAGTPGREELLLPKDLGLEAADLVTTEEALKAIEWDAIL